MTEKQRLIDRIETFFPQELQDLVQWVLWKFEVRNGRKTKVPYNASTGNGAMANNPGTWSSFSEAVKEFAASDDYDGLGFVFSEHDPYTGIDFDDCVVGGAIVGDKYQWIEKLDSYTEYSVSGTGAHVIVRGALPGGGRKSNAHGVEVYDRLRFFVVTGNRVPNTNPTIEQRQTELNNFHNAIFPPRQEPARQVPSGNTAPVSSDDQTILDTMFRSATGPKIQALWNGNIAEYGDDDSAADLALCNYLAFYTQKDEQRIDRMFRQSGLYREKWERNARTGETYGQGTIARAIAGTQNVYTPGYRNGTNGTANGHVVTKVPAEMPELPKTSAEIDPLKYRAEDGGIMDAWIDHYGDDWLFIVGPDSWHQWNDTHWALDKTLDIKEGVVNMMDAMNQRCSEILKNAPEQIKSISGKYAAASLEIPETAIKEIERIKTSAGIAKGMKGATRRSSARAGSVETMCRFKRGVSVDSVDVDDSLNLSNGVLSLASLEMRPHDRGDLFTYCLDYEHDQFAECPTWRRYISEVLVKEGTEEADPDLALLFQELLGYSLTPHTKHEVMIWMFGEGSNGKSVAISVVEALLGPMSMSIDFQNVGQPGNYDLADVPGKRVLLSTEAERNKSMAEGYIKRIVTGDTIKARPIYGSPLSFKSTAKIWWAMNDKPVIKDTTDSMWRRMKLIPFYRKFEEGVNADVDLPTKLLAELPGILNWAIDGLIRLTVNGRFTKSTASEDAKQQYREEANPVAQWVNTMTVRTAHPATLQASLFKEYTAWCHEQNEYKVTSTQFGKDLKRLRINSTRKASGWMYHLALVDAINR